MLVWGEGAFEGYMQLVRELAWLRENHPDKKALIGVAQANVDTVRQAGSCESSTISTRFKEMQDA